MSFETPGSSPELRRETWAFIRDVVVEGIVDDQECHDEFVDGAHGYKLRGEVMAEGRPDIFDRWTDLHVVKIEEIGDADASLISVANGTNGLVTAVAARLGVPAFQTEKDKGSRNISLSAEAQKDLLEQQPHRQRIIDDIGTTGSQAMVVMNLVTEFAQAHDFKPPFFDVLYTWQRTPVLARLAAAGVKTHTLYKEIVPTFSPHDCLWLPEGLCNQGVPLRKRQE